MSSKFKELRKLLQSGPFVPTPEPFLGRDLQVSQAPWALGRDPQVSQAPWAYEQLPSTNSAEPAETKDPLTAQSSRQVELHAEQIADNGDGQIAIEQPKSVEQLSQSIAKLFQPAQLCKEHLAQTHLVRLACQVGTRALRAAQELSRSCAEAFEVIRVDTRVLVRSRFTC
jgi:hypothetical protein